MPNHSENLIKLAMETVAFKVEEEEGDRPKAFKTTNRPREEDLHTGYTNIGCLLKSWRYGYCR